MSDNRTYEEIKESDYKHVETAKRFGIKDSITIRCYEYPNKFYLVLEALDLVMRVYNGEEMGTDGVDELCILMAIFRIDKMLLLEMPKEARAFFRCIVNPKNIFDICNKASLGYGSIHRAYSELRTYLIDNKERVTEVYNKLCDDKYWKELEKKYAKILKEEK